MHLILSDSPLPVSVPRPEFTYFCSGVSLQAQQQRVDTGIGTTGARGRRKHRTIKRAGDRKKGRQEKPGGRRNAKEKDPHRRAEVGGRMCVGGVKD